MDWDWRKCTQNQTGTPPTFSGRPSGGNLSIFARSALSIRQWRKTDVHPAPFVRKIIHFCERHLEGASLKILSVIWAIDFAWSENWMAVKWVSEWDRPVRGPFFGRKKVAFLEKSAKSGLWLLPLVKGAKIALFWTDVGGVTKKKVLRNDFLDAIVKASVKTLIETNHH